MVLGTLCSDQTKFRFGNASLRKCFAKIDFLAQKNPIWLEKPYERRDRLISQQRQGKTQLKSIKAIRIIRIYSVEESEKKD